MEIQRLPQLAKGFALENPIVSGASLPMASPPYIQVLFCGSALARATNTAALLPVMCFPSQRGQGMGATIRGENESNMRFPSWRLPSEDFSPCVLAQC
jgi:hypothetical protein